MSKILYNVKKVVLTPLNEKTGAVLEPSNPINVTTAEEITLKPVISQGDEKILRSDDLIIATASQPDLVYGYEVELKDNRFDLAIVGLLEGGELVKTLEKVTGYNSPMLAQGNLSKPFKTDIYVEERNGASIVGYVQVTLNYCLGTAPEFAFKRGEFYSPTFKINARENTVGNLPIKSIAFVDELPA